ncbi:(d)CMP kinase [Gorillibacterium timonense]|uniref:(d)CMP kinase n=1 Tax=Gorillibacterium timonense TaxID=1689269 RepID=UPI00071DAD0E|nr:(d)CMP kinase [Gorillibacterium timonense]
MNRFNIALDGPAGAGKSTVARLVASSLGFVYVDTGAMYRAVTWKVLQLGLRPDDAEEVARATREMDIKLARSDRGQLVYVDGEDITDYIRSAEINKCVSLIASNPQVRELLVDKQKALAEGKGVVMDGRDIGTKVLPDAEVKVFLTASARRRAERRYAEAARPDQTIEEMEAEISNRDRIDSSREVSPLRKADDAVLLDTTEMELAEVVDAVLSLCRSYV